MQLNNQLTFPCNVKHLKTVRNFVRKELSKHQINEVLKSQLVLAIDEVCTNLIIHSNQNDDSKTIVLYLKILTAPKAISIELKENGKVFDYPNYKEPKITDLLESSANGQLGLMLVRRIMDKIEYIQQENQNICRLYKSLA